MDLNPENTGELREFFANGGALYMLRDIPRHDMDSLWLYACQLLQQGDAHGARNLLQLLIYCDHWNADYLLSLGAACQQGGAHEDALIYLTQAARILVVDPRPSWLMALSAAALKHWQQADELVTHTLTLANHQPRWREIIQDMTTLQKQCRERLKEEKKDE